MERMGTTDGVRRPFEYVNNTAAECGYGDLHAFPAGGVPDSGICVSDGVSTVCTMGVKGERDHTMDEYAAVDSLFERTALAGCVAYIL